MSKKTQDFLIERSSKPIVYKAMVVVSLSYALLLFSLLLIVGIRKTLGIDATLIGLSMVVFGLFTITTVLSLYKLLSNWLKISYFVSNNQLFIKSKSRHMDSSTRSLDDLVKVSSGSTYKFMSAQNYGTVTLEFSRAGSIESVKLHDVSNPDTIASELIKRIKK